MRGHDETTGVSGWKNNPAVGSNKLLLRSFKTFQKESLSRFFLKNANSTNSRGILFQNFTVLNRNKWVNNVLPPVINRLTCFENDKEQ